MTSEVHAATTYPLSPMQHGMLFDYLSRDDPGVDVEQILLTLPEAIDLASLVEAWHVVARRHEVFRTSFAWDGLDEPVQNVAVDVEIPCAVLNWQAIDGPTRESRLAEQLCQDRAQGFDLNRAPLMRLTLVRFGPQAYRCIWTFHHLLLDGRSFSSVLREVFDAYEVLARGDAPTGGAAGPRYEEYVEWTRALDHSGAEPYWRELLGGFRAPTPLLPSMPESPDAAPGDRLGQVEGRLSEDVRARLEVLSAAHGFTLNTVVQGAWAILLARHSGEADVLFGATRAARNTAIAGAEDIVGLLINTLPVRASVEWNAELVPWLQGIRAQQAAMREFEHTPLVQVQRWSDVPAGTPLFDSILIFDREELGAEMRRQGGAWSSRDATLIEQTGRPLTWYVYAEASPVVRLAFDRRRFSTRTAQRILGQLTTVIEAIAENGTRTLGDLPYLSADEMRDLSDVGIGPALAVDGLTPVHRLIESQAARTPDATAVTCRGESLSFAELNDRANRLARHLVSRGVGADSLVGIYTDRSLDMLVAVLAVHKAGAAYVPLDPDYPSDRIAFMLEDAALRLVLTQGHLVGRIPASQAVPVLLDVDWHEIALESGDNLEDRSTGSNLAYVIYTSGSTGRPKGVMVEHRNVMNFFEGMDERIPRADGLESWLSVTSLSFDISVLELLWTLSRGFHVVLHSEVEPSARAAQSQPRQSQTEGDRRRLDFSLFYFSARADASAEGDPYRLLLEGARWADEHGFTAVWTPERHFHAFGGLYPNPAVISAALAASTKHIQIRAGSVVLPLHHPARVAEDWAVVDQLSAGRVGVSVASGWQPRDFVLAPDRYSNNRDGMFDAIEQVRRLWRGEALTFPGHDGAPVSVQTLPRPVQRELPIWVTAAGNPDTFRRAGEVGANLLTHLLGQSIDDLRAKIAIYREAWDAAGHRGRGTVSLMLHTFVGEDDDTVREAVREPMKEYLGTAFNLVRDVAWSFPTLKSRAGAPTAEDIAALTPEETNALMDHAFERYFDTSGLFGSPETCAAQLDRIREIDVDEVACLIDFGVDTETVLAHLDGLAGLNDAQSPETREVDYSIGALIERHSVTHLQCTPSQAHMLLADDAIRPTLRHLRALLIGGEAFPAALAGSLRSATEAPIVNMYGPTETTIWSSTEPVAGDEALIPIGRPIVNTSLYVLDEAGRRTPHGVSGELHIGGAGVVRGYLGREDLTAERFVADPFAVTPNARMYRTGDRARFMEDGRVEFLGRLDFQVKIRGHRIELGEIEAAIESDGNVREAVVIAREDVPGEQRLAAYVVPIVAELDVPALRESLRRRLPSFMVPTHIVSMRELPHTPNMKVDRKALPAPSEAAAIVSSQGQVSASAEGDVARIIGQAWADALGVPRVGTTDNFFDLGGDSLMVIRVHSKLKSQLPCDLALTDFFRFPTVSDLAAEVQRRTVGAAHATSSGGSATPSAGQRAAEARRAALARRRG